MQPVNLRTPCEALAQLQTAVVDFTTETGVPKGPTAEAYTRLTDALRASWAKWTPDDEDATVNLAAQPATPTPAPPAGHKKRWALIAPNGKEIVASAKSMLVTQYIVVTGKAADGKASWDYVGHYKDHSDTVEQRADSSGQPLFSDIEGNDWPENQLRLVETEH